MPTLKMRRVNANGGRNKKLLTTVRAQHNISQAKNDRDLGLLRTTLTEVIAVCETLGFTTKEIQDAMIVSNGSPPENAAFPVRHGTPVGVAAVLSRWKFDPVYCDRAAQPRVLPFDGARQSFTSLVKVVSPTLDPTLAKDLLLEGQAIYVDADGMVTRIKEYLPVFGAVGAIFADQVLMNFRTCARVQRRLMRSSKRSPMTSGVYGFGDAVLHRSKWEEFRWMTRSLVQSMGLIDDWVERHSVPFESKRKDRKNEFVEPRCRLLIDFPGDDVPRPRRVSRP